ncbi:MAG: endonuclease III [Bacteroidetes bacterium]|nr:endonuclease III [Bacteroidota bacterium]MBU2583833.1 endonuclease III [Bacteroidota bacterium]
MKSKKEYFDENRNKEILKRLEKNYPDSAIKLEFKNPFELLIATILSAQCTDARVNIVTEQLFKKFKTPNDFIQISYEDLEQEIFSTGFYKQKAKSIKACCSELMEKFNGEVPSDMESLTKLPGVGRKTASVVLGNAYDVPAIAVDTHVKRLSNLLHLVKNDDPEKIELELMKVIPKKDWTSTSHRIAAHGRNICNAKKPKCEICFLNDICPSVSAERRT